MSILDNLNCCGPATVDESLSPMHRCQRFWTARAASLPKPQTSYDFIVRSCLHVAKIGRL